MNSIHNIYWGIGQKELSAPALPSTLESQIQTFREAIANMEAFDFPGKAETLATKRAMLAEMELALEIGNRARAQLVRNALALEVAYALQPARRAVFVKQIEARNAEGSN